MATCITASANNAYEISERLNLVELAEDENQPMDIDDGNGSPPNGGGGGPKKPVIHDIDMIIGAATNAHRQNQGAGQGGEQAIFLNSGSASESPPLTLLERLPQQQPLSEKPPLFTQSYQPRLPSPEVDRSGGLEVKQPSAFRRFPSWFSFFAPVSRSASVSSPPGTMAVSVAPDPPPKQASPVKRRADGKPKSILKPVKPPTKDLDVPPPIQKSVFLRREEITRLTKFPDPTLATGIAALDRYYYDDETISHLTALRHSISTPNLVSKSVAPKPVVGKKTTRIRFDQQQYVQETYSRDEYERGGVEFIAKCLTPEIAMMIKRELNEVKREMEIHEDSRCYTQFYQIKQL